MGEVILIGSGFSKAISPLMPLLSDLSLELKNMASNVPGENVEHWMTYLSQSHPWLSESENLKNKALFFELGLEIKNLLTEKVVSVLKECPECPSWLQQFLQYSHDHRASIITLNYDTLIESAALCMTLNNNARGDDKHIYLDHIYPVPMTPANKRRSDMFVGSEWVDSFQLYKLHGSINWYYSGASTSTGETIYYKNIEKWNKTQGRNDNYDYETLKYLSDKVPLIVPPVMEKSSFFQHETIRTMWNLAGQTIRSANKLICIGYSLPETDLLFRFFVEQNAPPNHIPLYLVNPNMQTASHYQRLLGNAYQIDKRYVGSNIDEKLISDLFS